MCAPLSPPWLFRRSVGDMPCWPSCCSAFSYLNDKLFRRLCPFGISSMSEFSGCMEGEGFGEASRELDLPCCGCDETGLTVEGLPEGRRVKSGDCECFCSRSEASMGSKVIPKSSYLFLVSVIANRVRAGSSLASRTCRLQTEIVAGAPRGSRLLMRKTYEETFNQRYNNTTIVHLDSCMVMHKRIGPVHDVRYVGR